MESLKRFVVGLLISSSLISSAFADDVQQMQQSLDNANQQIEKDTLAKQDLQAQMGVLQQSIQLVNQKIAENNQEIDKKTKEIDALHEQMKETQDQLSHLEQIFNQRMRVLYEDGSVSYISVLLQATSFDDFLNRFQAIKTIVDADKRLVDKMKTLKAQLEDEQYRVQQDIENTKQKQQELTILQHTDAILLQQQQQQLSTVQGDLDAKALDASRLQAEIAFARQEQIYAGSHPITDSSANSTGDARTYNGSAKDIIEFAESFIGTPYVWGGTAPGGFDCSGFTQYVFGHFGIPLNRTSQSQFLQGIGVSQANLQPGDLVFFSTYGPGATHVGIYIGSGLMVNAEDYGVRIDNMRDSYWGPIYIGARRVVR